MAHKTPPKSKTRQRLSGAANMIDLSRYKLVFNDEFDALSLNTESGVTETWRPVYYWGDRTLSGNAEKQLYVDPSWNDLGLSAHAVEDGVLSITATRTPSDLRDDTGNLPYMSGMINSEQSFSQQYGYFEMRAQLPEGQGFWPAFWMLPIDGDWPPELDVMEVLGNDTTKLFNTVHTNAGASKTMTGDSMIVADMSAGFHTFGADWQKDTITFYFNGEEVWKTATPDDMHVPMYLLANLAVGGYWPGNPDASTSFPSSLQIDYIRAYQSPVAHEVMSEVPASWTPASELTFSNLDGVGASISWNWTTVMSDTQDKLKMQGDSARVAIGNARDNWIEGGAAQYQEYYGNGGNNVFKGGSGIDVFKIRKGEGNDTILDFSNVPGNADKVYLDGFHFSHFDDVAPFLTQVGGDVILQLDAHQGLKFANLTIDQLAPEQFAFFNSTPAPAPAAGAVSTEPDQGEASQSLIVPPEDKPDADAEPDLDPVSEPEPEQAARVLDKPDKVVSGLPERIEQVEEAVKVELLLDLGGEVALDKTPVPATPDTGTGCSPANWDKFIEAFAGFGKSGSGNDGWSKIADKFASKAEKFALKADIFASKAETFAAKAEEMAANKAGIADKMLAKKAVFEDNDVTIDFSASTRSAWDVSKVFKGSGFEVGNTKLDFGSQRMEAMNDRIAALQEKGVSSQAQKLQDLGDFDWSKSFAEGIAEQAFAPDA
jgi:beta-glucanase (GH16 family)